MWHMKLIPRILLQVTAQALIAFHPFVNSPVDLSGIWGGPCQAQTLDSLPPTAFHYVISGSTTCANFAA